ncbi:MAG: response regulator transcription factor, partial [Oscillibacter sp.]|nr:response regulator transcription factor [Oscillibacter sp.]
IMITARGEDFEKIMGLDIGADDYIVKPFSPGEVMARVRAVLRRIDRSGEEPGKLLQAAGLRVNLEDYSVSVDGRPVRLTKREVDMLWTLVHGRNRAYTREMLLDLLWGYDYYGDPRTVDSHMKRLRAKLDTAPHPAWEIRTIRNVGYKFEVLA